MSSLIKTTKTAKIPEFSSIIVKSETKKSVKISGQLGVNV